MNWGKRLNWPIPEHFGLHHYLKNSILVTKQTHHRSSTVIQFYCRARNNIRLLQECFELFIRNFKRSTSVLKIYDRDEVGDKCSVLFDIYMHLSFRNQKRHWGQVPLWTISEGTYSRHWCISLFCSCKYTSVQPTGFLAKDIFHFIAAVFPVIKDKCHCQIFISDMRLFVWVLSKPKK